MGIESESFEGKFTSHITCPVEIGRGLEKQESRTDVVKGWRSVEPICGLMGGEHYLVNLSKSF